MHTNTNDDGDTRSDRIGNTLDSEWLRNISLHTRTSALLKSSAHTRDDESLIGQPIGQLRSDNGVGVRPDSRFGVGGG